jgi:hypothetical protein
VHSPQVSACGRRYTPSVFGRVGGALKASGRGFFGGPVGGRRARGGGGGGSGGGGGAVRLTDGAFLALGGPRTIGSGAGVEAGPGRGGSGLRACVRKPRGEAAGRLQDESERNARTEPAMQATPPGFRAQLKSPTCGRPRQEEGGSGRGAPGEPGVVSGESGHNFRRVAIRRKSNFAYLPPGTPRPWSRPSMYFGRAEFVSFKGPADAAGKPGIATGWAGAGEGHAPSLGG